MKVTIIMLLVFSCIAINAATLILPLFVPIFVNPMYSSSPLTIENYTGSFNTFKSTTINAETAMEDKGNLIYRVLDLLNIGMIQKLINLVDTYIYSFPHMLKSLIGPMFSETQNTVVFGALYSFMTIIYALGFFQWWTTREI